MAQKVPPSNVVPFRKPDGSGGRSFQLPAWVPRELVGTATGWIVLLNLAVWIVMIVVSRGAGILTRFPVEITYAFGALDPEVVATQPWRLLSSTLVHADLGHIAMNMAILWFTGRQLERAYGSGRFVALYLFASLFGGVFSVAWHLLGTMGTSVGASGGVLGVVAGLAAFFWRATGRNSDATRQWLWFCGFGLVGGLVASIFGMAVDNAAHLGGMAGGFTLSFWVFAGRPSWSRTLNRTVLGGGALLALGSIGLSLSFSRSLEPISAESLLPTSQREGAVALANRDYVTAERKLAEAIEDVPNDFYLRVLRATALVELGREEEAERELLVADALLERVRAEQPTSAPAALAHAKVLGLLGRDADAQAALLAGVKGRGDGDTFLRIAEALEASGRLEDARLAAAKGRIAEPRNQRLREVHARINEKIAASKQTAPP